MVTFLQPHEIASDSLQHTLVNRCIISCLCSVLASGGYSCIDDRCIQDEGWRGVVPFLQPHELTPELRETLVCFVLVDPSSAHAFCSRYDFGPWPLLPGITHVPPGVQQV